MLPLEPDPRTLPPAAGSSCSLSLSTERERERERERDRERERATQDQRNAHEVLEAHEKRWHTEETVEQERAWNVAISNARRVVRQKYRIGRHHRHRERLHRTGALLPNYHIP